MATIFIIHGSYGHPEENWFPWLKQELEKMGHKVIIPKFPTPENQSQESWLAVFQPYFSQIDQSTIFIGHSLGPAFILHLLEQIKRPILASFLVAPFISSLNNPTFDSVNKTFYGQFNWPKIRQNCPHFEIFHSDNDPYVPLPKAEEVAKHLNVKITLVKKAGHFNATAGYTSFPQLLDKIKTFLDHPKLY